MKSLTILALTVISVCASTSAFAQQGDARIVAAREALRSGAHATLARLATASEDHLLDHYVEYWWLIDQLEGTDPVPVTRLNRYISQHEGSVPALRLRDYWLKRAARDADWDAYTRLYREEDARDAERRCQAWHARYLSGDESALDDVAAAWRELAATHSACDAVLQATAVSGKLDEDDVWWRFRRQIDSRAPERARATLSWLENRGAPAASEVGALLQAPEKYFDDVAPRLGEQRGARELALAALVRIIRQDPYAGHPRFVRIRDRLDDEERAYVYTVLGHHGALSRLPESAQWYAEAGNVPMTAVQRDWRVRAALRAGDWLQVEYAIRLLDADEQRDPEWVYWRARAHAEQGRRSEAEALYASISRDAHFYGILAAEEMGLSFTVPTEADVVAPEDKARVANDPGIRRALAFYRLEMPTEAIREWIQALKGRDRAFLIAAAHVALDHELYDRAINTAELADPRANFELRFLTPYRDVIEPQVRKQALDLAWVYGLMRQESRFMVPARSSAGAQGLMQVMPATGKWVARRIGMKQYHQRMLNDPDINVLLGTSYMRIIMGGLDDHPVLASAGYNAGPGRAQHWRSDHPVDATIYTATIPFDETRDYVKKVLANKVIYAAMFEQRPQSLKSRLGVILPRVQ